MANIISKKGFSLIEVLVVIAVFVFIIGAVIGSIQFFYRSNAYALEQSFAINSARTGIERMVKDMREASFSDEGSYPVIAIDDNSFSFYSDIDSDIFVEKVRYFLDDTDLKKGVVDSSGDPLTYNDANEMVSIVSDNVRNTAKSTNIFTFFNASGTPITNFASTTDVRFVKAEVIVNVNPLRFPNDFTLHSSATLRNVRESQ